MEVGDSWTEARGGESNRDSGDTEGGRRRGLSAVVGVRIVRVILSISGVKYNNIKA